MPTPDQILIGLTSIANEWRSVAVGWHAALALSLLAALQGWHPSTRAAAYLLTLPFLSVGAASFASGNLFNGAVFAVLTGILISVASYLPNELIRIGPPRQVLAGALLVAFGAGYPHFLETDTWTMYLYAAPLGLLPCPTLATAIGFSLALGLFQSRHWAFTLAAAGLAYGTMGVFVLGVTLDYVLLAGTLVVVGNVALERTSPAR
jgi:hypothetical protein